MPYFSSFPKIYYNGRVAIDLMKRSSVIGNVLTNYNAFYPFVIEGDVKPETIAERYYGSADRVWIIWFSNQTFDPYFSWPLTDRQLMGLLSEKYGSIETAMTTVVHYKYNPDVDAIDPEAAYRSSYLMAPQTWSFLSAQDKGYWTPVYAHEYEDELNMKRRNIRLIDNDYVSMIETELTRLMHG